MNNFVFSLNSTIPIFLVMIVGFVLMRLGLFNQQFNAVADKYVFKVALPLLLFTDIATADIYTLFNWKFVIFCAVVTTCMFLGIWLLASIFMKDKSMIGAFSQAAVRGSGAILGIAFVKNMYGSAGSAPLMIIAAIPLYNIYSVIILSCCSNQRDSSKGLLKTTLLNIIKNPIILGILFGLPFALFRVSLPSIPLKALNSIANTATPIALLMIGAEFEGKKAVKKITPTAIATLIKLFILPMIILPIAYFLGFHDTEMISILILAGSPTTVACYIMAKNMGNDEVLTSSIVVCTTLLSSVSLTLFIFILKSVGVI